MDVPFVASGAIVPTGITAQVDRITAMRAADDLRVTLLRRSTDFAAALGADLAGTGFPFRAPLMISTAVARTEHASTFSGGVSTTSEDVGSAGDSTRYGANKGSSVAGMSSYAFVLLACGVGVIVMGGFFAVMARRRTLAGIASTPSPTGVAAAPGAAGTGSKPSSTQWKRASIKAAHAGGGGTETSFFESDLGATDVKADG